METSVGWGLKKRRLEPPNRACGSDRALRFYAVMLGAMQWHVKVRRPTCNVPHRLTAMNHQRSRTDANDWAVEQWMLPSTGAAQPVQPSRSVK